jgi:hypothetical protein
MKMRPLAVEMLACFTTLVVGIFRGQNKIHFSSGCVM